MRNLDFLVIGAAKSGTTTLFELSRGHPGLFMPRDKEVPFFSNDASWNKGLDWYLRTYFPDPPAGSRLGTITPHYMIGLAATGPREIARRIHDASPDVKLVALLRNPVERAFSHYRMMFQRGYITTSFSDAVDRLLDSGDLDRHRHDDINETDAFLFGSEYGRILSNYYECFRHEQILVLYTEHLQASPDAVLRSFFEFLDVDPGYRPERIGQAFRRGGSRPRLKLFTPGAIYRIPFVRHAWKNYTPQALRTRIEHSINLWNTRPDDAPPASDSPGHRRLLEFYAPDVRKLERLTGSKAPWPEWD